MALCGLQDSLAACDAAHVDCYSRDTSDKSDVLLRLICCVHICAMFGTLDWIEVPLQLAAVLL
jgi:hypothetical protein